MPASNPIDQPITILAIPADPTDAGRLRIDKERREVAQALSSTEFRDKYAWKDAPPGCSFRDITSVLHEHKPNILLITGHASPGIPFKDEYGNPAPVSTDQLANFLKAWGSVDRVWMIVCDSGAQAQSMADAVGQVIGLEGMCCLTDRGWMLKHNPSN